MADSPLADVLCSFYIRQFAARYSVVAILFLAQIGPLLSLAILFPLPFLLYTMANSGTNYSSLFPLRLVYWNCRGALSKNPDVEALDVKVT